MKKLLVILLTLTLCLGLFSAVTISASAQEEVPSTEVTTESNLPSTDEVIDNLTNGTHITEEDKQLIKDLVAKVESYTKDSDSFFVKFIVPLIVAGVLCALFGIVLLLPIFRANAEKRTLKKMLTNSKDMIAGLKSELDSVKKLVDAEKIEEDIKAFMSKEIEVFAGIIQETLTKNGVEISKIEAILVAIKDGAINAWKGSPEAVACLTQNADAQMLEEVIKENAKLKTYIEKTSGQKSVSEALV